MVILTLRMNNGLKKTCAHNKQICCFSKESMCKVTILQNKYNMEFNLTSFDLCVLKEKLFFIEIMLVL